MVAIFRVLIAISTLLFAVTYWLPYADGHIYSADVVDLRSWDGFGASIEVNRIMEIGVFALGVAIPVMMFLFVRASRGLFLTMTIVLLISNLGFGVRVLAPVEVLTGNIISMADGAILAISYFTSISSRFERKPSPTAPPA